ncbi:hypothetical protein ACFL0W_01385 [Nanoarchaeota archaeon]
MVLAFKKFNLQNKKNKWITLVIGSVAKTLFLFAFALLFVTLSILPKVFLIAMGPLQLGTAIGGGVVALGVQRAKKKV